MVVLLRAALRRDRALILAWLIGLTATVYASAAATPTLYPDLADRTRAAAAINTDAAVVALYGPINATTSLGDLAMTKLSVLYAIAVGALALILMRRHTRAEEESGRAEIVGSTRLGLRSQLLVAAALTTIAVGAVGTAAAFVDVVGGLEVRGSIAFGASWTAIGLVGAAWTALLAQVLTSARAVAGAGMSGLVAAYLVRMPADVSPQRWGWLGWISPFGWSTRLHAWGEPRWWVLLLPLATAALMLGAAWILAGRRDVGSGLIGVRPGPSSGRLGSVGGLGGRLHAVSALAWSVAMLGGGALMAALVPGLESLIDTESGRQMLGALGGRGALADAFFGSMFRLLGLAVCCWPIVIVAHAAGEESAARAELVLATGTGRRRWARATAVLALVPPVGFLLLAGLGSATVAGRPDLVPAAVAPAPAVLVIATIALLLWSLRRRAAVGGWAALAVVALLDGFGDLLHLPAAVRDLSPFAHIGTLPTGAFDGRSCLALLALSALGVAIAQWSLTRRDIG